MASKTIFLKQFYDYRDTRSGITIAECVVALVLSTTAISLISQFQARSMRAQQEHQTYTIALRAIVAAREAIGSWQLDRISKEAIQAFPMNEELLLSGNKPHWIADVKSVSEPIEGKCITLGIEWISNDRSRKQGEATTTPATLEKQPRVTPTLQFWVPENRLPLGENG